MPSHPIDILPADRTPRQTSLVIASVVSFNFINYLCIGSTLAILPTYVHLHLGINAVLAGLIVSIQYIATFASRPQAGHIADRRGARYSVCVGLIANTASGILLFAAPFFHHSLPLGLTFLILSRFALGIGESLIGTGANVWGIGRAGAQNTAQVISWNGVCTYLGLAIGAPLGALIEPRFGLAGVGLCITAVSAAAYFFAIRVPRANPVKGEKVPTLKILVGVAPFGVALALAGMGFSVIATFITLYFAHLGWTGAVLSLTVYGLSFVFVRLVFAGFIDRVGGYRVMVVSCAVEIAGLLLLALGHTHILAYLGCALIGCGFSLVFPALGIEVSRAFPPSVRGAVIGIYTAFADLSFFLTGPIAGAIIHNWGYPAVFLGTTGAVIVALLLTLWMASRTLAPAEA